MIIEKKVHRVPRAPHLSPGIRPEGGASTNQEFLVSGTWYPDRTMVPLVLQPFLSYTDSTTGELIENALPELVDGNWYRLDANNRSLGICEATKISVATTGTDTSGNTISLFSIVSTPGAQNYGRITIKENIPPGQEVTYIFEATLSTSDTPIREFFTSRCSAIMEVPDIEFDNNPTALYDPFNDPQYFTIMPSLTMNYPVVWKWKSFHELEGGWVDLGSTQLDWAVEKVGNGIKIDRKKMPDTVILKCYAEVTVDDLKVMLEKVVTHTRRLPPLEIDIIRVGELPENVDTISPYAEIKYGKESVTNDNELAIEWLNSSNAVIATGINPLIKISALGASGTYKLQVRDKGGRAALMDQGKLLTDGGALLLTRSKV